jgi:hypothetical protein
MNDSALMPKFKDGAIFTGWIAGILLLGSLCWFLTGSLRADFLMRSVNRSLKEGGYSLAVGRPAAPRELEPETTRMGQWFFQAGTEGQDSRVLVFTMIDGGCFFPCAALVKGGTVEEIVPLNSYAGKFLARVSPGVINLYKRRIEGNRKEEQ